MATFKEIVEKLKSLSPEEFKRFQRDYGGEAYTLERYAQEGSTKAVFELKVCNLLGLVTEQEKANLASDEMLLAAKKAADAATRSAQSAEEANLIARSSAAAVRRANIVAIVSVAVAIGSLIVSIIALWK